MIGSGATDDWILQWGLYSRHNHKKTKINNLKCRRFLDTLYCDVQYPLNNQIWDPVSCFYSEGCFDWFQPPDWSVFIFPGLSLVEIVEPIIPIQSKCCLGLNLTPISTNKNSSWKTAVQSPGFKIQKRTHPNFWIPRTPSGPEIPTSLYLRFCSLSPCRFARVSNGIYGIYGNK